MKLIVKKIIEVEGYEYDTEEEQEKHIKEMTGKGYKIEKKINLRK